jgi:MEMO1 family protein
MWRHCAVLLLSLLLAVGDAWPRERHYSFWSDDPQPFLNAIRNAAAPAAFDLPTGQRIRGGIVTHHFLASGLMVRFFSELAGHSAPSTIILLGPNHHHHGLANISFSSLPWKTPFGTLPADQQLVRTIAAATGLPEDQEAFSGEHSVGVLIPFLKYYFPSAHVVPILVDLNARSYPLHRLREVLSTALEKPDTLLLLSMDFSHNSVVSIADTRDIEAQKVISEMDSSKTEALHVDCRKGLWLLLESLKHADCNGVLFREHTNSARLTGRLSQPDVTSYFTVFFYGSPSSNSGSGGLATIQ